MNRLYRLLIIFGVLSLLSGCSDIKINVMENAESTNTAIPTIDRITEIPTKNVISTQTPEEVSSSTPITEITSNENLVKISDTTKGAGEYLYKDVKITFIGGIREEKSISYINLDDLSSNDESNSDLVFAFTQGKEPSYFLTPANNATVFFSGKKNLDYISCIENLQNFRDLPVGYFPTGLPFCVRTSENRIAIGNFVVGSLIRDEDKNLASVDFIFLVYNKKVE